MFRVQPVFKPVVDGRFGERGYRLYFALSFVDGLNGLALDRHQLRRCITKCWRIRADVLDLNEQSGGFLSIKFGFDLGQTDAAVRVPESISNDLEVIEDGGTFGESVASKRHSGVGARKGLLGCNLRDYFLASFGDDPFRLVRPRSSISF